MPEANVLYTVTAVVVAGLVVWVAAALKMAKQPWARPEAAAALAAASKKRDADVPVEKPEVASEEKPEEKPEAASDEPKSDEPADDKPADDKEDEAKV